jgi:hypothetical protein
MGGAYTRIRMEGVTLNARSWAYVKQVRVIYGIIGGTGEVRIAQGSYNKGVTQSAGTHDGGGAIDFTLTKGTSTNYAKLQKAARMCMGAAWWRKPLYRNGKLVWSHHVHVEIIGDKEMSLAGRKQVQDYYAGLDGLASHARDRSWRPAHLFPMSYPMPRVDLSNVVKQSKAVKKVAIADVRRVQLALNLKTGSTLTADGIYGAKTKAVYKRWESSFTGATADGIPGPFTLWLLGAGRFNVVA